VVTKVSRGNQDAILVTILPTNFTNVNEGYQAQ
jgi:hypothetical protein